MELFEIFTTSPVKELMFGIFIAMLIVCAGYTKTEIDSAIQKRLAQEKREPEPATDEDFESDVDRDQAKITDFFHPLVDEYEDDVDDDVD